MEVIKLHLSTWLCHTCNIILSLQQHAEHTLLLKMRNTDLIQKPLNLEAPCVRKIKDKSRATLVFSHHLWKRYSGCSCSGLA